MIVNDDKEFNRSEIDNISYTESNNFFFLLYKNFSLLFTCIIGYFSYLYSNDSYYFESKVKCVSLRNWVNVFSWYCFIIISKEIFLMTISILKCFKFNMFTGYSLFISQFIIFIISTLVSIVLNLGITFSLFKNEPCGSCHTLALLLVIYYWIVTLFVIFLIICSCRYCGYSNIKNLILTTYNFKTNEQ